MNSRREFLAAGAVGLATASLMGEEKPKARTKFAVNVEMWWSKLMFLDRLKAAKKLGFEAVEIWPWRGRDVNAIADMTQELGLKITQFTAWGFTPGMNDPKNKQKVIDEVGASCETAKKWKCDMCCVVAGNDIPGKSQQEMHDVVIDTLKAAAPIAEKAGVTLILEPMNIRVDHKGHCLYGSAPAMKIVQAVGSTHVKVLWDLYHMHITEGDLCGHLREGMKANVVAYTQIADHPGRQEPGTGEIHYPRVFKELEALGYKGYVGLECRPSKSEETAQKAVLTADQMW
jgi:hydroxypyruvate isomerase